MLNCLQNSPAIRYQCFVAASLLLTALLGMSVTAEDDLPTQAASILRQYCSECHAAPGNEGGIDYITDAAKLIERKKVVGGKLDQSRIWVRLNDQEDPMPPDYSGSGVLSSEEKDVVRRWILDGAKLPKVLAATNKARNNRVTTAEVVTAVHRHLDSLDEEDRSFQRYFVLNHLYNMPPERVSARKLALVRAAVSKVINSLSWRAEIVLPRPIDEHQTVLAIDLRDLDWEADADDKRPDLWSVIAGHYPYGLTHELFPANPRLNRKAEAIYEWAGFEMPWVRADWFVAVATQPAIYHAVLYDFAFPELADREKREVEQPDAAKRNEPAMTSADLRKWLRVDVLRNLRNAKAVRAAFTGSGVSSQPRLIERHPAIYGAYWESYDFKKGNKTHDLTSRPLGPVGTFKGRGFSRLEFQHDGGEIIFHLPNGMHGYLLVDAAGRRITFGPPDVVEDRAKTRGNGVIVNGLSCMACHRQGLNREFKDDVRYGIAGFSPQARRLVRRLYLDRPELDVLMDRDDERFRRAVADATLPFLKEFEPNLGEDGHLVEPVGTVAKQFLVRELDLRTLAAEIGMSEELLKAAIKAPGSALQRELLGVANGRTIKRDTWEEGSSLTLFQKVAQVLKQGRAVEVIPPER